ncbi:hypothetical protein KIN20_018070 [Parelaphostrongylus tenuis]|uniref:Uncharacterized protein n=1 Tax=Parelaphostrongylus tenuis TaxID=148309 RepID=A0AAD5MME4_PARTN|nr:hypothetical protein KIN20_018070 [Parelaphostrongylus tenuis]
MAASCFMRFLMEVRSIPRLMVSCSRDDESLLHHCRQHGDGNMHLQTARGNQQMCSMPMVGEVTVTNVPNKHLTISGSFSVWTALFLDKFTLEKKKICVNQKHHHGELVESDVESVVTPKLCECVIGSNWIGHFSRHGPLSAGTEIGL